MAKSKKNTGKKVKKKVKKKVEEEVEENEGGAGLDDAFADDEDVSYAESKPRKLDKNINGMSEDEIGGELDGIEEVMTGSNDAKEIILKASKPINKIKKGDKIKVDGHEYEVASHYVLMDHKTTKEMAIELFDSKTDKDYQLRYFDDRAEVTLEFYELQEIMYFKKPVYKIEW